MRFAAGVLAMSASACLELPPHAIAGDGGPGDAAQPACLSYSPWSDPAPVDFGGAALPPATGPTISGDQRMIVYEQGDFTFGMAMRDTDGAPFDVATAGQLDLVNGTGPVENPTLSFDGERLIYQVDETDEPMAYVSVRGSDGAFSIGALIRFATSPIGLRAPDVWDAGNAIFFSAEDSIGGDYDLWWVTCTGQAECGAPDRIDELVTPDDEFGPTVRGDALEIAYAGGPTGTASAIYSATRPRLDAPFVAEAVMGTDGEWDPEMSPDGTSLYTTDGATLLLRTRACLE